jgi:hypothetical protein
VSLAAFVGTPPSPNWFAVDPQGHVVVRYPPGTPSTALCIWKPTSVLVFDSV